MTAFALALPCAPQAAIGGWHCLALDADGQVYCWGGNEYQQCGWVAPEGDESPGDAARQGQLGADGTRAELRWPRCVTGGGNGGAHGVLPNVRDILVPRVCMPGLKIKQVSCKVLFAPCVGGLSC